MLTPDGLKTDAAPWHKLSWPSARWAYNACFSYIATLWTQLNVIYILFIVFERHLNNIYREFYFAYNSIKANIHKVIYFTSQGENSFTKTTFNVMEKNIIIITRVIQSLDICTGNLANPSKWQHTATLYNRWYS